MTYPERTSPVCNGFRYAVNPDDPSEGTDVVHDDDNPCPLHVVRPALAGADVVRTTRLAHLQGRVVV